MVGETKASPDQCRETSRREVKGVGRPPIEALNEDVGEGGVGHPKVGRDGGREGGAIAGDADHEREGVAFIPETEGGGGGREGGRGGEVRGEEGFEAGDELEDFGWGGVEGGREGGREGENAAVASEASGSSCCCCCCCCCCCRRRRRLRSRERGRGTRKRASKEGTAAPAADGTGIVLAPLRCGGRKGPLRRLAALLLSLPPSLGRRIPGLTLLRLLLLLLCSDRG